MPDSSLYPRVTTILHEGFNEGGLETWAVSEAMKKLELLVGAGATLEEAIPEAKRAGRDIMEVAARRGTIVHTMIEKQETAFAINEDDLSSVLTMYSSFLLWAKERNFTPIAHEVPVCSDKHGFRGTLDCIGTVDGRLELIDWKTSNAIRMSYRMQTAAYWYGLKESSVLSDFKPDDLKGIRIVRFGSRSVKGSQTKDMIEYEELIIDGEETISVDFNAFLAAKRLYDWKLKRK